MNLGRGVAPLLIVVLFAAGCGDSGSESTSSASSTESSGTSSSTATTAAPGPSAASCVQAWNRSSNSAAQKELDASIPSAGTVTVGSDGGDCVLAAYAAETPSYDLYRQSGDAFSRDGGGPVEQYNSYIDSIGHQGVIVQGGSGKVTPAG